MSPVFLAVGAGEEAQNFVFCYISLWCFFKIYEYNIYTVYCFNNNESLLYNWFITYFFLPFASLLPMVDFDF